MAGHARTPRLRSPCTPHYYVLVTCPACGETDVAPDGMCPACGAARDAEADLHDTRARTRRSAVRSALPLFPSRASARRQTARRVRQGRNQARLPDPVEPALDFEADDTSRDPDRTRGDASVGGRLRAALIDALILVGMDALVVLLTLRAAALPLSDVAALPLVPLAGFLLLLDGGYLAAFVGLSGRTIGEMIAGLPVRGAPGGVR